MKVVLEALYVALQSMPHQVQLEQDLALGNSDNPQLVLLIDQNVSGQYLPENVASLVSPLRQHQEVLHVESFHRGSRARQSEES